VCDAIGVAEVMLGLPGFRFLEALEGGDGLVLCVETLAESVACPGCAGVGVVRSFANYRLRILLHAGGVRRPPTRPLPPFIPSRSPR
jgi:hypothetical protein